MLQKILLLIFALLPITTWAQLSVQDGTGQTVTVPHEVYKIITLTPHTAELAYSAGAGSRIIAVTKETDYPQPVALLPQVGGYNQLNLESIIQLQPDLVIAWQDGGQQLLIQQLRQAGIAVFVSHPLILEDISNEIHALGVLSGTPNIAKQNTAPFRAYVQSLRSQKHANTISAAFLVGEQPLYAISNGSFLGRMMQACGAKNAFGDINLSAFSLNAEALLKQQLDIVFIGSDMQTQKWQQIFSHSTHIPKIAQINADLRPTLRIKSSLEQMCLIIDSERRSRH